MLVGNRRTTVLAYCASETNVLSQQKNLPIMLCLIAVLLLGSIIHCQTLSGDTLLPNQQLNDSTMLVSAKGTYVLGFFSPSKNTMRYLGIWYRDMSPQTVVWVANRQNPILSNNGTLTLTTEGILYLRDGGNPIWSTGSIISTAPRARLLDSGNFNLTDDVTGNLLWQSFDQPCDTLLPGMVLGYDLQANHFKYITSWKSSSDPSPGDYLVRMEPNRLPDLFLYQGNHTLEYRTGVWNGKRYDGIPEMKTTSQLMFNMTWNPMSVYYSFEPIDDSVLWRLVIQDDGLMHRWYNSSSNWIEYWHIPEDTCDSYAKCGLYGVCSTNDCMCLPGFIPNSQINWNLRTFTDGCVRNEDFNCTKENDFMKIQNMKLPDTFNTTTLFDISFEDCRSACLANCSCIAFAYIDRKCAIWQGPLVDMVQFNPGDDLYLRVASATGKWKKIRVIIICSTIGGVLFLSAIFICMICLLRRRKNENIRGTETPCSRTSDFPQRLPQESNLHVDPENFNIRILRAATNDFHDNKLGEGCFGPVYKATLEDGRVIAVKRLAREACRGLKQFLNEVNLLANLSHRNLVQLLGYCIDDGERILCYEYMPNGSLDKFLEDPHKISSPELHAQFDWKTRSKILEEISYGILYLHDECGKKIVHRDLKPGNILLDENMCPRISDFGFAKLCRKDQRSTYTSVFAGTKGYMAPEMLAAKISPKVDVFSFGIIIMEVVTGRQATSFPTGIINHVAKYWMENKELELIDPRIKEDADKEEVERFIVISMLCVQYDQDKRPEMRKINAMLNSMTTLIPFVPRFLNVDWGISFEEPPRLTESPSVDLTAILAPPSVQSSNS